MTDTAAQPHGGSAAGAAAPGTPAPGAPAHSASAPRRVAGSQPAERSAWTGWVFFAGVMMLILGSFEIINALVALFNDQYYLVGPNGLVVSVDYTTWGWVHLFLGAVAFGAGLGVMLGQMWARVVGIVLAGLSAIANLAFIAAYPVWSILIIALDVIVIYALAMHGAEARRSDR